MPLPLAGAFLFGTFHPCNFLKERKITKRIDKNDYNVIVREQFVAKDGIIYNVRDRYRARAKTVACRECSNGYRIVRISLSGHRISLMAHHVVWFLVHGFWPEEIDHIDGNRSNNNIANLREVTRELNTAQRKIKNRCLPRGVTYAPQLNKKNPFVAQCGGHVGYFNNPGEASIAYQIAFKEKYGEENRE